MLLNDLIDGSTRANAQAPHQVMISRLVTTPQLNRRYQPDLLCLQVAWQSTIALSRDLHRVQCWCGSEGDLGYELRALGAQRQTEQRMVGEQAKTLIRSNLHQASGLLPINAAWSGMIQEPHRNSGHEVPVAMACPPRLLTGLVTGYDFSLAATLPPKALYARVRCEAAKLFTTSCHHLPPT